MSDEKKTGATFENVTPLRPVRPCPECGKPSQRDSYPFCSPRCNSVDLNRWLSDAYVIPGRPVDDSDVEDN
ncbi:DNA gyrase inhibitor YacG [Pseudochrobactrum sp. MP213Fo]|uniref:DNA gyrase inhibitor YacG n=1 Tax=Pseudochrobactrum sp. MP213Fo TaxID=3022250 RepID=UPI003BA0B383